MQDKDQSKNWKPWDRVPYQPITKRPAFKLPNGARVAVWTIVNIEHWLPNDPMPRTVLPPPMGVPFWPDLPNWTWHEYGMRVGFWRFLKVLGDRNMRATLALNGSTIQVYEDACIAAREANWEFMGHGFEQIPMHRLEDERKAIQDTVDIIRDFTGRIPRGWESPGLTETKQTLDLLAEAGIDYVANWVLDDQPVSIKTSSKEMVSVPYTVEINDVVMSALQQQPSDEIFRRGCAQFDTLYKEGATTPRVMAISIHPYLTGVPHRIGYLEKLYDYILGFEDVWVCTGEEILDWYLAEKTRLARA
jgi:peptidoglycan/xylan/chitin deacetylase (PgdA/CDA1 family)